MTHGFRFETYPVYKQKRNYVYALKLDDGVNAMALEFIENVIARPNRRAEIHNIETYWRTLGLKYDSGLETDTHEYNMYRVIKEYLGDKELSYLYSMEGIVQQVSKFDQMHGKVYFLYQVEGEEDEEFKFSVMQFNIRALPITQKLYDKIVRRVEEMNEGTRHAVLENMDAIERMEYIASREPKHVIDRPNRQATPDSLHSDKVYDAVKSIIKDNKEL